jgi:hypothetical protein
MIQFLELRLELLKNKLGRLGGNGNSKSDKLEVIKRSPFHNIPLYADYTNISVG